MYLEEVYIVHVGREEKVVESKQSCIYHGFHTNKLTISHWLHNQPESDH